MKKTLIVGVLGVIGAIGSTGCASGAAPAAEQGWSKIASLGVPAVRVGEPRVIDPAVNPIAPVGVTAEGGALQVSYTKGSRTQVARLDATSLERLASAPAATQGDAVAAAGATRVVLEGGDFVVVWKRGSAEWGYRAMAQEFGADGRPHGTPVVISPPDADVMATPQAVTTDGRHVVATFAVSSGSSFQLIAVAIDPVQAGHGADDGAARLAHR